VAKAAKPVTADQIAAQYSAEAVRWAHPTRRDVQVVLTASQSAAAKALSALRAGQGWAAVSRQYGSSQLSSTKTLLTKIHPGTHDAAFERAVFAAPVGRLSGPALVGSGWIVFKVLSSTPLAPTSLQAATPILRSELTATTQNSAVAAYLKSFRTSWRSRTRCAAYLRDAAVCGS
jgi:peptidyl-prolyl cis-trans isomerase D